MQCRIVKQIFIYCILLTPLTGCDSNKKESALNHFNAIVAGSNRIIIHFKNTGFTNGSHLVKVIHEPAIIDEFEELLKQSVPQSKCSYINGTMAFFKDSARKGYLEFSVNPDCLAFYLHYSGKIIQYKMSAYCAMFLESVKQGEK